MTKNYFVPQRDYLRKLLRISREGFFFSSNECETVLIMSKTVLSLKMSHIGKFRTILLFCIVFVRNHQKLPLHGKKISSDLSEVTFFLQLGETGQILPKTVLHLKLNYILIANINNWFSGGVVGLVVSASVFYQLFFLMIRHFS